MDYGYDLAVLINSGLRDERDAERRIIKRLKRIAKDIDRSDKLDQLNKIQISDSIKDARRIIEHLMYLIDVSPDQETPKWVFKFRLMRLVDTMLEVGSHNGAGYSGMISSENANATKSVEAARKNNDLKRYIIDEAREQGRELKNSKQLAQDLQDGVCRRAKKSKRDRGYGWRTIQRQIAEILDEESANSGNGTR